MDWRSEQQATFEKVKILVKQIKGLSISQTQLPFELDVSRIPKSMGQVLWQRQTKGKMPREFWL